MNVRKMRVSLWIATGLFAAGTVLSWLLGLAWAGQDTEAGRPRAKSNAAQIEAAHSAIPPLSAFSAGWDLDLQRPLFDAPKGRRAEKAVKRAPLSVRLTGTVTEPGHSLAMFITNKGRIELKRVGQTTAGAEVLAIDENSVRLLYQEEEITLKVEEKNKR